MTSTGVLQEVRNLARTFLSSPVKILVDNAGSVHANPNVMQKFVFPSGDRADREDLLVELLQNLKQQYPDLSRTLIFVETKRYVDTVVHGMSVCDWGLQANATFAAAQPHSKQYWTLLKRRRSHVQQAMRWCIQTQLWHDVVVQWSAMKLAGSTPHPGRRGDPVAARAPVARPTEPAPEALGGRLCSTRAVLRRVRPHRPSAVT